MGATRASTDSVGHAATKNAHTEPTPVVVTLAPEDGHVLRAIVRHAAHQVAPTTAPGRALARIDDSLTSALEGNLSLADTPGNQEPRLPGVFQFFTIGEGRGSTTEAATDAVHITDPASGNDLSFCRKPTTVTYLHPTETRLCTRCCAEAVRYLAAPRRA
jgi:hypothetical protein